MINVLELIDGGFLGGGQTHILSLIKCIDNDKFKTIVAASGSGEFKKAVQQKNITFKEIEFPKFYRSKYLNNLNRIVKENSIDIIHSHGGVAGMYSRFYKKKFNSVKTIHSIHGIHYINSSNFFRKFFSLSIEQYLVPFTNIFICVSDADYEMAKELKIIIPEKTSVIKNGIDINKFFRKPKNKNLLDKLNIKENDFIIGNISRFDYQKNQRFIILNSQNILYKYPNIKILLAGDGKFLNECKLLAQMSGYKDRIIFTGEVTNPEDYYSLLNIFIFPSLWEGLSISLIEAMASSCCILASDIPANKELIKDNFNGLTFNLNDVNEYAEKLMTLVEDESMRNTLSEQARKDSLTYREDAMAERVGNEYLKLIK